MRGQRRVAITGHEIVGAQAGPPRHGTDLAADGVVIRDVPGPTLVKRLEDVRSLWKRGQGAIERCFPLTEDRRAWFQKVIQPARPHIGYKALCALAQAGIVDSAWSTNFDQLAAKAAAAFGPSRRSSSRAFSSPSKRCSKSPDRLTAPYGTRQGPTR